MTWQIHETKASQSSQFPARSNTRIQQVLLLFLKTFPTLLLMTSYMIAISIRSWLNQASGWDCLGTTWGEKKTMMHLAFKSSFCCCKVIICDVFVSNKVMSVFLWNYILCLWYTINQLVIYHRHSSFIGIFFTPILVLSTITALPKIWYEKCTVFLRDAFGYRLEKNRVISDFKFHLNESAWGGARLL